MRTTCFICGISMDKEPLMRNGPTGEATDDWRCWNCLPEDKKKERKDEKYLIDLIHKGGPI